MSLLRFDDDSSKRIDIKLLLGLTEQDLVEFPVATLRKLLKSKCEQNPMLDTTALFENLSNARKQAKKVRRCQVETQLNQFDDFCSHYSVQISVQTKFSLLAQRDELMREIEFYKREIIKQNFPESSL